MDNAAFASTWRPLTVAALAPEVAEMSRNSYGLWPRKMRDAFSPRGSDETDAGPPAEDGNRALGCSIRACRQREHVEEGLTLRAEGQLSPMSGLRRRLPESAHTRGSG